MSITIYYTKHDDLESASSISLLKNINKKSYNHISFITNIDICYIYLFSFLLYIMSFFIYINIVFINVLPSNIMTILYYCKALNLNLTIFNSNVNDYKLLYHIDKTYKYKNMLIKYNHSIRYSSIELIIETFNKSLNDKTITFYNTISNYLQTTNNKESLKFLIGFSYLISLNHQTYYNYNYWIAQDIQNFFTDHINHGNMMLEKEYSIIKNKIDGNIYETIGNVYYQKNELDYIKYLIMLYIIEYNYKLNNKKINSIIFNNTESNIHKKYMFNK